MILSEKLDFSYIRPFITLTRFIVTSMFKYVNIKLQVFI